MAAPIFKLYGEIGANTKPVEDALAKTKSILGTTRDQLSQTIEKFTGLSLGALAAGGAVGALAIGLKKAWDAGREGASLEFTIQKFDRLAKSIGSTSKAILEQLRAATRGMRSDADLMASATDVISLGLVRNERDVVRLGKVMGALSMDMGQVVLALANQTTMRFDQLGVSVMGFEDRLKNLKKTGMDANAAFTEAFLQQAEAQVEKVGTAADTNAGKIARMDAAWANLGDTLKLALAPAVASVAEEITKLLTLEERRKAGITLTEREIFKQSKTYEDYETAIKAVYAGTMDLTDANGKLIDMMPILIANGVAISRATFNAGKGTEYWTDAAKRSIGVLGPWQDQMGKTGKSVDDLAEKLASAARQDILTGGTKIYSLKIEHAEAETKIQDEIKEIEKGIKELSNLRVLTPAQYKQVNDFWKALQLANKAEEDMRNMSSKQLPTAMQALNASIAPLIGGPASFRSAADAAKWLQEKIDVLAAGTYHTKEQQTELDGLRTKLEEAKKAAQELEKENEKAMKKMVFDMLWAKAASDTLTQQEFDNLMTIGTAFGVIDENAANMAKTLNSWDLDKPISDMGTLYTLVRDLMNQPSSKTITVNTVYTQSGSGYSPGLYQNLHTEGEQTGIAGLVWHWNGKDWVMISGGATYAGGGSWIVPPGYQENYPLPGNRHASSGEKITVTPAGNTKAESRDMQPIQIIINGVDDPRMLARLVAREFQRR